MFIYMRVTRLLGAFFILLGRLLAAAKFVVRVLAYLVTVHLLAGVAHSQTIYFTEIPFSGPPGNVLGANADGTQIEVLAIGEAPWDIEVDSGAGKIYWTDLISTVGIKRSNLDGSSPEIVIAGSTGGAARRVAIDQAAGKLYFSVSIGGAGDIDRSNLDGSGRENVLPSVGAQALALDVVARKLYWATHLRPISIRRANFDGSDIEDVVGSSTGVFSNGGVADMTIDQENGKIYWAFDSAFVTNAIWRANLDGTNPEKVIDVPLGTKLPRRTKGVAIDRVNQKLYWVSGQQIGRAELDGTGAEVVMVRPPFPAGIAIHLRSDQRPTADAGPDQEVRAGDTVLLDGSASFDDNTPSALLVYAWSFSLVPAGSNAVILNQDTPTPSFLIDVAGTYVVQLIVTDEAGLQSLPNDVMMSSDNLAPTANAGLDQLVIVGSTVFLDGTGSTDPEDNPLTYSWTIISIPAGSNSVVFGADTPTPSFVADLEGQYDISLEASDAIGPGIPDSVEIMAVSSGQIVVIEIASAGETVGGLGPEQVTTLGNQNALMNFLIQAIAAIQEGDLTEATNKLQKALARTDGCVLRGAPDGNGPGRDWITDCTAQVVVYGSLNSALTAITP